MASNSINVYAPASPNKYPYTIGANFTESITEDLKNNNKSRIAPSATLYGKNINYAGTGGTLAIYWYDNNKHTNGTLVASQAIANTSMGVTYTVSGSIDVEHDTDGKLQGYAKAVWTKTSSNSYVPPSTSVDTGWQTLTSIARATKINDFTATIGEPIRFTWLRASESFTHELKLVFNGKIIPIGTNLENEVEWKPDESLYQKLESASDTGTLGLTTYNGETQVGETQMGTLTLNAKRSVAEPVIITKKIIDTNEATKALTGNENTLVFYKSNTNLILEFSTREYATATKVIIENVEYEVPEGTLQSDGKTTNYSMNIDLGTTMRNNFNISITDTRFTIKDLVVNDNYILYIPLDCNSSFKRVSPTTGDVGVQFNGNYYNGSFGSKPNTFKITYKYKKKNDTSYSSPITLTKGTHYTISGNKYYSGGTTTASTITLPTNFDYRSVYEGVMYVEDALTSIPVNFLVVKGVPIFWWTGEKVVVNGDLYVADNDGNNMTLVPKVVQEYLDSQEKVYSCEYINQITKPSFAQMSLASAFNASANTKVTSFGETISSGDFVCEPENARIRIPAGSAEYVELYSQVCGGAASVINVNLEQDGTTVGQLYALINPGGNTYYCMPAGKRVVKIPDTSKDAYVTWWVAGYNTTFLFGSGFHPANACFGAIKL